MQYIKGIDKFCGERDTAITFGKFDGLHQGHDLLIQRVEEHQKKDGVDGVVVAFDMSTLYPDVLMTNQEKAQLLEERVAYFIDCPFDAKISTMEAEHFIKEVIVEKFHAKYIVIGSDFHFGYQKRGDAHMLQKFSTEYGYQLEVIQKKCYEGREISSTYIKEELKKGNIDLANRLLGRKRESNS